MPTCTSNIRKFIKGVHVHNLFELMMSKFDKKEVKSNLYSYKEVKMATNNFDKDNKLGEGGFGVVYKVQYMFECQCLS